MSTVHEHDLDDEDVRLLFVYVCSLWLSAADQLPECQGSLDTGTGHLSINVC